MSIRSTTASTIQSASLTTLKLCEYFKYSTTLKKLVYSSAGCVVAEKTYNEPNATSDINDRLILHCSAFGYIP